MGYIMSLLTAQASTAQDGLTVISFLTGFLVPIVAFTLNLIHATHDATFVLKFIFRIFPPFCLGDSIIQLSSRKFANAFDENATIPSPFALDITGYNLLYMLFQIPILAVILCLMESAALRQKVRRFLSWRKKKQQSGKYRDIESGDHEQTHLMLPTDSTNHTNEGATLPRDGDEVLARCGAWLRCVQNDKEYYFNEVTGESKHGAQDTPFYVDPSVAEHAREVNGHPGGREGDYVTVQNLTKTFPARGGAPAKVAVRGVSFGVQSGELFAFLGTNGAGKTTTLSVLSGETLPTEGEAFIAGHNVVLDAQRAHENLGFCSQFNSLLEGLTTEEHLHLFAAIRGVPEAHITPSVELLLSKTMLSDHRDKLPNELSGGNKRKLSVAIALMGGPAALFLDEPSAGMDPMARRALWDALEKAIKTLGLSVIITTHHLEEIEGLSRLRHRITIMVEGRLQCLGTLAQLKQKLGDAYEVTVKVSRDECEEVTRAHLVNSYPGAEVVSSAQGRITVQIPKQSASLPGLFRNIEAERLRLGMSFY